MADIIYSNPENDDILLNEEDEIASGDDADCECCEGCDCETEGPTAFFEGAQTSANSDGEGCCFQFADASIAGVCGEINYWEWDFGDGNTLIGEPDPSHCYEADPVGGFWDVTLKVRDIKGCEDQITLPFFCECDCTTDAPIADFSFTQTSSDPCCFDFFDESSIHLDCGTAAAWEWDFGDGNTSTAESPSHCYIGTGPWAVRLTVTDSMGCSDTVEMIVDCDAGGCPTGPDCCYCEEADIPDTITVNVSGCSGVMAVANGSYDCERLAPDACTWVWSNCDGGGPWRGYAYLYFITELDDSCTMMFEIQMQSTFNANCAIHQRGVVWKTPPGESCGSEITDFFRDCSDLNVTMPFFSSLGTAGGFSIEPLVNTSTAVASV